MLTLSHPWLLLLIPLPLILRRLLPAYRSSRQAVRIPWFIRMARLLNLEPSKGAVVVRQKIWRTLSCYCLWCLLCLAMARPQLIEPAISKVVPTRDLLLLVDLSGSMDTKDFTNQAGERVDRLTAVKEVLDDFLSRREGDRVGLVVFGNAAFVQVPFTQDLNASRILLNETAVRMAGPRTAFGDAIGLGISLFEKSEFTDPVMIALTDGNDTGSKVPPAEAAQIAQDKAITIHVVGVGDPSATGEELLDKEALQQVATTTGGTYFHADDRKQLSTIYQKLDSMETHQIATESHRPRKDLFYWPLAAFLIIGMGHHLIITLAQFTSHKKEVQHG